ncbi:MAG TPA: hypothetical protein VND93_28520, partial [Myxococcales bacterium]|nr:hypothetical protein [Myxococcales bacterium]
YTGWILALDRQGEICRLASLSPGWLRLSQQNGDLYGAAWLKIFGTNALLAAGDMAGAVAMREDALTGFSAEAFTPQQCAEGMYGASHDLYRGDPAAALRRLDEIWEVAKSSGALMWQWTRVCASQIRGGAAVALARIRPAERGPLLAFARKVARRLDRENRTYARAAASLIRGAIASTTGDPEAAVRELNAATAAFGESHMRLYAACASRRKGELLGGDEGRAMVGSADAALRDQGIQDVDRWTAMYAPGFSEA